MVMYNKFSKNQFQTTMITINEIYWHKICNSNKGLFVDALFKIKLIMVYKPVETCELRVKLVTSVLLLPYLFKLEIRNCSL